MSYRISTRRSLGKVETAMQRLSGRLGIVKAPLRQIAEAAGVSHWTVREAIADLECLGRIEVVHRGMGPGGGDGASGCYRIDALRAKRRGG